MAWQLIYTSAPRLLQAGRSGFGTVARHQAISPLVVSAIERVSQFSRLPGVDTDRVIFSYRILSVAGGRFHVLSSIRDAGTDYSGRTNHVAHHLIAEAREVALLGPLGPSPADVLLSREWATGWTDQPRYFDGPEEVIFGGVDVPCHAGGSAWERVAGTAGQARLLTSEEAIRGAYLIKPASVDLREIFAESLRLIPERLWQISFTTSLQPGDAPADFHWIGIEEDSPLRAETETWRRRRLNLANPAELPPVDVVYTAVAKQVERIFDTTPAKSQKRAEAFPELITANATPLSSRSPGERESAAHDVFEANEKPRSRRLWWAAGIAAAVTISCFGYFFALPLYTSYQHRKLVRAEIEAILSKTGFFSDQLTRELQSSDAVDCAKQLAETAERSWQAARNAEYETMLTLPVQDVREHAISAGLNTPPEMNDFDLRLHKIADIHQQLTALRFESDDFGKLDQLEKMADEYAKLTSATPATPTFDKIKLSMNALIAKQRQTALHTWLSDPSDGRIEPARNLLWFKSAVAKAVPSSEDEEAKVIHKANQQVIEGWTIVSGHEGVAKDLNNLEMHLKAQSSWPPWLQAKARGIIKASADGGALRGTAHEAHSVLDGPKTIGSLASQPTRPVLYFIADAGKLSSTGIKELTANLKFELRKPGGESTKFDYNHEGTIRRDYNARMDGFQIANGILTPEANAPKPPFLLIGTDAQGSMNELLRVYVDYPLEGEALFAGHSPSLKRDGQALKMAGELPNFAASLDPQFLILTPVGFDGLARRREMQLALNGQGDLRPVLMEIKNRVENRRAAADSLSKQATGHASQEIALEKLRVKVKEASVILKSDEAKKEFREDAKFPAELVGDFAKALAIEWNGQLRSGKKDKADEGPFETLRKAGKDLGEALGDNEKARARNKIILDDVQKLDQTFRTADKQAGLGKLRELCDILKNALGTAKELEAECKRLNDEAAKAERDAKEIEDLPINRGALPPGEYALVVKLKGVERVKLFSFDVH